MLKRSNINHFGGGVLLRRLISRSLEGWTVRRLSDSLALRERGLCAFTLAEVLITLAIIGVVAAMTIPTLISKINDQEYISKTKKMYSIVNQMLLSAQNDNSSLSDNSNTFSSDKDSNAVAQEFQKYFKGSTYCSQGTITGACANANYKIQLTYPVQQSIDDKTPVVYYAKNLPRLMLADGSIIYINTYGSGCAAKLVQGTRYDTDGSIMKNEDGTPQTYDTYTYICGDIRFDVNGSKKPNQFGRDIYFIVVHKNNIGYGANIFGSESLKNILDGKSNPLVYKKYSTTEELYNK